MNENELSEIIIESSIKIHRILGPGLLESVYEKILAYELKKKGLNIRQQVPIPITYENIFLAFKDRMHSTEKISKLGFRPYFTLTDTVKDSMEWLKKNE